jgi:hypothetical protein
MRGETLLGVVGCVCRCMECGCVCGVLVCVVALHRVPTLSACVEVVGAAGVPGVLGPPALGDSVGCFAWWLLQYMSGVVLSGCRGNWILT